MLKVNDKGIAQPIPVARFVVEVLKEDSKTTYIVRFADASGTPISVTDSKSSFLEDVKSICNYLESSETNNASTHE